MSKSKKAFVLSARLLAKKGPVYFWTFTFDDVISVKETRKRWNYLLTLLLRKWPNIHGLRVYELHEDHGLHVHLMTNLFIHATAVRGLATQAGWGRINVKQLPATEADYLAKDLDKKRAPCLKGWRLWAAFGDWQAVKAKNVRSESLFTTVYQACKQWKGWVGRAGFFDRMAFTQIMFLRTIEKGWESGLGPQGKPYAACSMKELGL